MHARQAAGKSPLMIWYLVKNRGHDGHPPESMRLDKWLWCARFYKTRSLAADAIGLGRVSVNQQLAKASRELRVGDTVALRQGPLARTVVVRGLSAQRGPAPVAQQLYAETADSIAERERAALARKLAPSQPTCCAMAARPSAIGARSTACAGAGTRAGAPRSTTSRRRDGAAGAAASLPIKFSQSLYQSMGRRYQN